MSRFRAGIHKTGVAPGLKSEPGVDNQQFPATGQAVGFKPGVDIGEGANLTLKTEETPKIKLELPTRD